MGEREKNSSKQDNFTSDVQKNQQNRQNKNLNSIMCACIQGYEYVPCVLHTIFMEVWDRGDNRAQY